MQTIANGTNNAGQIVGAYESPAGMSLGFLLNGGTFTTIDVPGTVGVTQAFDINSRGQIVGNYLDVSGAVRGYLLDRGTFTTIDLPGASDSLPFGINAKGQIVGDYGPGFNGFLAQR